MAFGDIARRNGPMEKCMVGKFICYRNNSILGEGLTLQCYNKLKKASGLSKNVLQLPSRGRGGKLSKSCLGNTPNNPKGPNQ